jgi:uncharacterized protein (DUF433 family)
MPPCQVPALEQSCTSLQSPECPGQPPGKLLIPTLLQPPYTPGMQAKSQGNRTLVPHSAIVIDPEIMNGIPCFRGTRVPFKNLIDYLEGGHPLDEFLRQFPTVTRELAVQSLEEAKDSLVAHIA